MPITTKNKYIYIDGKYVEQVKSFQYLGALVTEDGRCEKEILRRIGIAKSKFNDMHKLLTTHDLSLKTKLRLTKCYIWSVLLYGSETWSLTKGMEKRIEAFKMWAYRKIAKISWKQKINNQKVLKKLNLKKTELLTTVKQRKLKYYGHIRRHPSIQKSIVEGKIEGKRGRGRKRTNWLDSIASTIGKPINKCAKMAENRDLWRSVTVNVGIDKTP